MRIREHLSFGAPWLWKYLRRDRGFRVWRHTNTPIRIHFQIQKVRLSRLKRWDWQHVQLVWVGGSKIFYGFTDFISCRFLWHAWQSGILGILGNPGNPWEGPPKGWWRSLHPKNRPKKNSSGLKGFFTEFATTLFFLDSFIYQQYIPQLNPTIVQKPCLYGCFRK